MCCGPKAADMSGHAGVFPVVARCWYVRKPVSTAASSHHGVLLSEGLSKIASRV